MVLVVHMRYLDVAARDWRDQAYACIILETCIRWGRGLYRQLAEKVA